MLRRAKVQCKSVDEVLVLGPLVIWITKHDYGGIMQYAQPHSVHVRITWHACVVKKWTPAVIVDSTK